MRNEICKLLNIQYPIIQGGMAWVANAQLAAAVSDAGGLGLIAAGNAPAAFVQDEIRKAKRMIQKPFGVNVMLMSPYANEVVEVILAEGVSVVTTGAGNPAKYMEALKEKGIKVIPVVPSVALAKKMEKLGADAVISEGMEAGGHIGKLTTMAMLPQIVDAVNIPVIGAGGIGDGRGMAAAFMLGAKGVQIGTRFLVAKECTVHENYKKMVLKAKDIDTIITGNLPGLHPVRALRNKMTSQFAELERQESKKESPNLALFDALGTGAMRRAVEEGDVENGSVMAGQIAGLVDQEQSCAEIIQQIITQFRNTVKNCEV